MHRAVMNMKPEAFCRSFVEKLDDAQAKWLVEQISSDSPISADFKISSEELRGRIAALQVMSGTLHLISIIFPLCLSLLLLVSIFLEVN